MSIIDNIRYRDLARREATERDRLEARRNSLEVAGKKRPLTEEEREEQKRIKRILDHLAKRPEDSGDPLFVAARKLFNDTPAVLGGVRVLSQHEGRLEFEGNEDDVTAIKAALILGLLVTGDAEGPQVVLVGQETVPDTTDRDFAALKKNFWGAVATAAEQEDLASLVLPILAREGDPDGRREGGREPQVDAGEFADVVTKLYVRGITVDEPQLRRRVNEALDRVQRVGDENNFLDNGIDLPDLDDPTITNNEIVAENVRLMGPMIVAAMFEELKAFTVIDKLVELFQAGQLPIGPGEAGKDLYQYWKEAPNRMNEGERRNFYAMTMGIPGGDTVGQVNRDFNDLWIRFVSSVSSFVRQNEVDRLLRADAPFAVGHQQIRKAARDLAANLSLHGYGMSFYAALELQQQIKFMIKVLGDAEIRSSYGARDMWQVIDQVATLELGGAKTSSRYRTLATCGAIITAWLANNVSRIMRPTGPIIDIREVRDPTPPPSGHKPTSNPSDYDLVNACELWLADTATSDERIEELSQPREAPVMTSKPIPIPSMARDMLGDMPGLGLGLGGTAAYARRGNGAATRQ